MKAMYDDDKNEHELDEKKLNQMKAEILRLEQSNLKTGELPAEGMADRIKTIITNVARQTF